MRNSKYVNFRDSKLTRLLKEALSGNCKTVMVAHISPASAHYDESRNTLVFAERARNITNKVSYSLPISRYTHHSNLILHSHRRIFYPSSLFFGLRLCTVFH